MDDITITKTVNKIYNKKLAFFERYSSDLIIALIIIYIFLTGTTYYYVLNHLPSIKANWPINKCNPLYLPFAGIILDDKNKSNLELVDNNFQGCVRNILTSISADAFKPIYYISNLITNSFNEMSSSINSIRAMFSNVRTDITDTTENISGRTLNITMPVVKMTIAVKNMMSQTIGVITTGIYTLFGSYLTLSSLLGSIIEFVGILLGIIAAAIVISLLIPIAGPAIAAPMIAFEAVVLTIFIPMILSYNHLFNKSTSGGAVAAKHSDACFGKYTPIQLENNTTKTISDIIIGDILHDGSIVTGTMKMSSYGSTIYNLNDLIVTGIHRVYHETAGWIKVFDHPQSYEINDYRENILYCLNTNTKVIKIGEHTFSDWDDLDDTDLLELNKSNLLPKYLDNKDIHPYLDNGFEENTLVDLEVGTQIKIKDIEVNDIYDLEREF